MKNKFDVKLPDYAAIPVIFRTAGQVKDWGHEYLRASEVYGKTKGEKSLIFILDTAGVFDHPDLKANSLPQFNKNFTTSPDKDGHGHGHHCAGIAAAVDNDFGVIGCAPSAKLVAVKVLNDSGSGSYDWISKGIRYVADLDVGPDFADHKKIISLSLGGSAGSADLENAVNYAIEKGVFIVAAAGNSGWSEDRNTILYPGRYEQVVTVASIGKTEQPSSFSSGGEEIDVAAPGEQIFSTHKDGGYVYLSGTSMATPYVAGVVALLLSMYPEIENQYHLEDYLEAHAKDIFTPGEDMRTGAGAPILTGYTDDPGTPPEDPEDPPPPPPIPTRNERAVLFPIDDKTFTMYWRTASDQKYKILTVDGMLLEMTTNLFTEMASDVLLSFVQKYYSNRGLILPSHFDLQEAVYYTGRFLEIIARNYEIEVSVEEISGTDEAGRNVLYLNEDKTTTAENRVITEILPQLVIESI
ncbi:MAG TPA: S8 family serine peptidase [Elusimicrobiales bacterium]|nr:S8 family serine peptidase [Elusimicrobiales bacterium]